MKTIAQTTLVISLLTLTAASSDAALRYWDNNGSTPGGGSSSIVNWGDNSWTLDPTGASATSGWGYGDTAVFSAGTDATGAFTINTDMSPTLGGLVFEEGTVTIYRNEEAMAMTNEFLFPIDCRTNAYAILSAELQDNIGTCGFLKTGPGTIKLNYNNPTMGGTNYVNEGVVSVAIGGIGAPTVFPLGTASVPTVVTNGATLSYDTGGSGQQCSESFIIYGSGVTNGGALRGSSGSPQWSGGVLCLTNARICWEGGGEWLWKGSSGSNNQLGQDPGTAICATNGSSAYDLTIGGNGGTIRMNINGRWAFMGTGKIIKEGKCRLRTETPALCTGAVLFNGGEIFPRAAGGGLGSGPIYVTNAPYVAFVTTQSALNATLTPQVVLAEGANLYFTFSDTTNKTPVFTCNGVISGPGGISATNYGFVTNLLDSVVTTNRGKAVLTAVNTYTGNTLICSNAAPGMNAGILALTGNGSIARSAVIDVQQTGTFDVSGVTVPFALGTTQLLKGAGCIVGNVTANGTIAPGSSIGNLTFSNNLVIAGNLSIEVDKTVSPSNDVITVVGTLTNAGTGTLTVANIGAAALAPGDSFQVFSKPVLNGQALNVVGGSYTWVNKLAVDGSIAIQPPTVVATNLTIAASGPSSFSLQGNGGPNLSYNVYASTNVTDPMAAWWLIGTTNADVGGLIRFLDTEATNAQRFYRFGQ